MKNMKSMWLLLIVLTALSSVSVNGQTTAEKNKLEKSLKAAGYKIKNQSEVKPTDWEKEEFNLQSKYRFEVKAVRNFPGTRDTFPRYAVEIEVFENESDAKNRLENLRKSPPGFDTKMNAEYILRDGFQRKNLIYVISTDAVAFSEKFLQALKADLEKAITD